MTDEIEKRRNDMGWGIPASILLHVIFTVVLFFHLPLDLSEPQKEESVSVEIVPPPEEPEKKAEEKPKAAEEPQPEEAKKEEPPPPPKPPKQDEAKKEEPPPPPPQEEAKQEPPPASEQARGQPIPPLRPVFEFGEKDTGPRKAQDGNSSQEATVLPPETKPDVEPAELPKQMPAEPSEAEAAEVPKPQTEQQDLPETQPANPVPDDIQLPEVGVIGTNSEQNGPNSQVAPADTKTEIVAAQPVKPKAEPAQTPPTEKPVELTEAKRLFSQSETGDANAVTAMGNVPRGVRGGQLCITELREQLRHVSPSYVPELLPAYRLPNGTLLEVRRGAFRTSSQWYDLSFRCEVNEEATKILSFAFDIGAPVPRSEWQKRGFPPF